MHYVLLLCLRVLRLLKNVLQALLLEPRIDTCYFLAFPPIMSRAFYESINCHSKSDFFEFFGMEIIYCVFRAAPLRFIYFSLEKYISNLLTFYLLGLFLQRGPAPKQRFGTKISFVN
jgi:hypothetical protein